MFRYLNFCNRLVGALFIARARTILTSSPIAIGRAGPVSLMAQPVESIAPTSTSTFDIDRIRPTALVQPERLPRGIAHLTIKGCYFRQI